MVFFWSLLVLGTISPNMAWYTSGPRYGLGGSGYTDDPLVSWSPELQPSETASTTSPNETELIDSMEHLRSRYLQEIIKADNLRNELQKANPSMYSRLNKLQDNITAMESDLKTKYLFFYELAKSLNNTQQDLVDPVSATSIIVQALEKLSQIDRKTIIDYLNFSEGPRDVPSYQPSILPDIAAGTEDQSILPTSQDAQSDLNDELRKSLKYVEILLIAANNSLPYELQKNDSLTLLVHIIRTALTIHTPLTFNDIKPIFVALSKTSQEISRYLGKRTHNTYDSYERRSHSSSSSTISDHQLDFSAVAIHDALEQLCNVAIKLDTCGSLLKSYFQHNLGEKTKSLSDNAKFFEKVQKIANAAKFC
ncbi:hypothetical protein V3C99_013111, partial [Haemonchus contortus]